MNLRETLGAAFESSDLSTKPGESDVDRIAAMGLVTRLGSKLWRLKYGNDPKAFKTAYLLLAKRLGWRDTLLVRLCDLAVREWCLPMCGTCHGAKEIIEGDLRIVCAECEGIGVKRYTDRERERLLGIPPRAWEKWAKKYEKAQEALTTEEIRVNTVLNLQLERY